MIIKNNKGFTLLQLMQVVAIIVVLFAVAAPSFSNVLRKSRLETSKDMLLNSVRFAKREAVSRGNSIGVCASRNLMQCDAKGTKQWGNGWIVFMDINRDGLVSGGEAILAKFKPDKSVGVYVPGTPVTADPAYFRFTASGKLTTKNLYGSPANRTFCIVDDRLSFADTKYFRRITLDRHAVIRDKTEAYELTVSKDNTGGSKVCVLDKNGDATGVCLEDDGKKCLEGLF